MCGRFTLICEDRESLTAALGVPAEQLPEAEHRPRYNIAPTDSHWVLHIKLEDRELLPAKWGLVNRLGEGRHARSAADQRSSGGPGKGTGVS